MTEHEEIARSLARGERFVFQCPPAPMALSIEVPPGRTHPALGVARNVEGDVRISPLAVFPSFAAAATMIQFMNTYHDGAQRLIDNLLKGQGNG